jgi:hypothetical protein
MVAGQVDYQRSGKTGRRATVTPAEAEAEAQPAG